MLLDLCGPSLEIRMTALAVRLPRLGTGLEMFLPVSCRSLTRVTGTCCLREKALADVCCG
jgi:hypothetical protein